MELLPFAILLVVAFGLSITSSLFQHKYYMRTVNKLARGEHRSGLVLVSGRGKGRLRGAIVLLLIDRDTDAVERALAMQGASVFARFRDCPELLGPLRVADPAPDPGSDAGRDEPAVEPARQFSSVPLRKAYADALGQYERLSARAADPESAS